MLKVLLLDDRATPPTVGHTGEDLGYDLYALEDVELGSLPTWVRTGIAVEDTEGHGFLVRDRSSMAGKGVFTHGGVIDAGYRGEIKLNMTVAQPSKSTSFYTFHISAGDKVAQMVPVTPLTTVVEIVTYLSDTSRGGKGFGSTGK